VGVNLDYRKLFTLSSKDTGTINFVRIMTKLSLSHDDYPYVTVNSTRDMLAAVDVVGRNKRN
jgi:hypothetical protein